MQITATDLTAARPVYDRAAIMREAWAATRHALIVGANFNLDRRDVFARELRTAWANAKWNAACEIARAKDALTPRPAPTAEGLRTAIDMIEAQSFTTPADRDELAALRAELAALVAEDTPPTTPATPAEKRAVIEAQGGKIVSVVFVKKDGTLRTMKVQPAALKPRLKGDAASPAAKKATATRKARHPHLYPVYDVEAQAARSINLETVQTITAGGQTYRYA